MTSYKKLKKAMELVESIIFKVVEFKKVWQLYN